MHVGRLENVSYVFILLEITNTLYLLLAKNCASSLLLLFLPKFVCSIGNSII